MLVNEYKYKDCTVEIFQHPIYYDFEYVVKKDNKVISTNTQFFHYIYDAEKAAESDVDYLEK
jgi:hypothetical protein